VVWSIDPALGSISSNGVYTAPTVIAAPQTVNVIATSLADKAKSTMAQVQLVPPQKVEVRMDIGFDTAKDVIAPQYDGELKKVAEFLKSYPTASAEIEGHTDNIGAVDYNRGLSQRRADSVRKALIEKFGIESARLTAKGYGPDRPVAGNDTAAGRAKNRRVVASFSAFKK
jgi:outer membrane protein OmpA-like peptidoglycan-associated protein